MNITSELPKPLHIRLCHNLRMLQPRAECTNISVKTLKRSLERIEDDPICSITNGVHILQWEMASSVSGVKKKNAG